MKILFLIRDNDIKDAYTNVSLPDGVKRIVGKYAADGGDLYFISFTIDGNTIENARILATIRDDLPDGAGVRILHDEASAKFCELLYPHFSHFEKGLREAIIVATCAERGNFDDQKLDGLETKKSLNDLINMLFIDNDFVKNAKVLNQRSFAKDELIAKISTLDEHNLWGVLFSDSDMSTFRKKRFEINERRNDVMHHHKMPESVFDDTRKLMKRVNNEIDDYLERVRSDVSYPKERAANARVAARMFSEAYEDTIGSYLSSLDNSDLFKLSDQTGNISQLETSGIVSDSLVRAAQAASHLNSNFNLGRIAQLTMNQQLLNLTASVSKAVESIQDSIPKFDLDQMNAIKMATESMKAAQATMNAQWIEAFKGFPDYLQYSISRDALKNLELATLASTNFTADLEIGAALSHASESDHYHECETGNSTDNETGFCDNDQDGVKEEDEEEID